MEKSTKKVLTANEIDDSEIEDFSFEGNYDDVFDLDADSKLNVKPNNSSKNETINTTKDYNTNNTSEINTNSKNKQNNINNVIENQDFKEKEFFIENEEVGDFYFDNNSKENKENNDNTPSNKIDNLEINTNNSIKQNDLKTIDLQNESDENDKIKMQMFEAEDFLLIEDKPFQSGAISNVNLQNTNPNSNISLNIEDTKSTSTNEFNNINDANLINNENNKIELEENFNNDISFETKNDFNIDLSNESNNDDKDDSENEFKNDFNLDTYNDNLENKNFLDDKNEIKEMASSLELGDIQTHDFIEHVEEHEPVSLSINELNEITNVSNIDEKSSEDFFEHTKNEPISLSSSELNDITVSIEENEDNVNFSEDLIGELDHEPISLSASELVQISKDIEMDSLATERLNDSNEENYSLGYNNQNENDFISLNTTELNEIANVALHEAESKEKESVTISDKDINEIVNDKSAFAGSGENLNSSVEYSSELPYLDIGMPEVEAPPEYLADKQSSVSYEREALIKDISQENKINSQDLKKMIGYLDMLFDKLPEDTIREFSNSEYFDLYKKIMTELGI